MDASGLKSAPRNFKKFLWVFQRNIQIYCALSFWLFWEHFIPIIFLSQRWESNLWWIAPSMLWPRTYILTNKNIVSVSWRKTEQNIHKVSYLKIVQVADFCLSWSVSVKFDYISKKFILWNKILSGYLTLTPPSPSVSPIKSVQTHLVMQTC